MPLLHLEPVRRRTSKGDVLAFLCKVGGLQRQKVGRIELTDGQAVVEIPEGGETRLTKTLDGQTLGDRPVRVWVEGWADGNTHGDHFERLARLLDLESAAEVDEAAQRVRRLKGSDAERAGTSLLNLVVVDEDTGLGGRYLLTLAKQRRRPLPWSRLRVGSPVTLSPDASKRSLGYNGVICEWTDVTLTVALGRILDELDDHDTWRLDLSADEIATKRQRTAMQQAASARGDRLAELRDVLLGSRPPSFEEPEDDSPTLNQGLNHEQREAVRFALSSRDVALIHGPPGTGKTTAVVELIRQAVASGEKVLACAASNMAVDNMFERLLASGVRVVRLGHPARVMPELRANTLDLLVQSHADVRLARRLAKEAMGLFRKAARFTRARPEPGQRREDRAEGKSLLDDARRLEDQAVEQILDGADVICSTTTGLNGRILGIRRFDLAVIDEACQSIEPGCWIPLLRCDRVVLSGDHRQLPPTVVSRDAAAGGLGVSLFERMMTLAGPGIARRLSVQYRMHESIMEFPSMEFYDAELEADGSVATHLLADLPDIDSTPLTKTPAEFLDTAGAGFDEEQEADGESRLNPQEATLVCRKVAQLLAAGVDPIDIAVIAPYAAQVRLLRERLDDPNLEIDSVDGFQGREKEAVVISLVRSNSQGEIGFLADIRRMNVAMTRARRKLLIVGDSATLSCHPFYRRMIEHFESFGAYRTVWEEPEGV